MYNWFIPKGVNAEITVDSEWHCVHPFISNLEISENKEPSSFLAKKEVKLFTKDGLFQVFRGSNVFSALDKAEVYLSELYPFNSIKISIGDKLIELKPTMEDVVISVTNSSGGEFCFRNKSSTFFRLLLQSKIVDNEIHDLESWEQMSIRDWIVYKLFNIKVLNETKKKIINIKRDSSETGYL